MRAGRVADRRRHCGVLPLERAARLDSHHVLFQALENLQLRATAPFCWQIIDHDPRVIAAGDSVKAASV